jgi:Protein of unknown function (DUF2934)
MDGNLSDRIRERAYEIWVSSGCRHGEAEQHWFAAEQEIRAASALRAKIAPTQASKTRRALKRSKTGAI